jgi:Tat protein secretion system quality control protein TatD with DNase activity
MVAPEDLDHAATSKHVAEIPWEIGVHDAHCHPTDTMSTTTAIPAMKARTLTIMATRSEDQHLVRRVASSPSRGGGGGGGGGGDAEAKIIPSFGHHPWFSHLIYDDEDEELRGLAAEEGELKRRHYGRVLVPAPEASFVTLLPPPRPRSVVLAEVAANLGAFPHALVGEIGMDRGFRLPYPGLGDTSTRRKLSPHRVSMSHQKLIFVLQLRLAGEFSRPVSVHGVQCHGAVFDTFRELWRGHEVPRERQKDRRRRRRRKEEADGGYEILPDVAPEDWEEEKEGEEGNDVKPFPPRICMHSFSAPLETLRQYLAPPTPDSSYPSEMFFSFSTTINARPGKGQQPARIAETVAEVPREKVLVESDLHTAGEDMDCALQEAVRLVCRVKQWEVREGVETLGKNWRRFVFGDQ